MDILSILTDLDCTIVQDKIGLIDEKENKQFYSRSSLLFSNDGFCKIFDHFGVEIQNVFLYYDLQTLVGDIEKGPRSKFNNSIKVLCTIGSIKDFIIGFLKSLKNQNKLVVHYPVPKNFNHDSLYFFLSLRTKDSFGFKRTGEDYLVTRNARFSYCFNPKNFRYPDLKQCLNTNSMSQTEFRIKANRVVENYFLIY